MLYDIYINIITNYYFKIFAAIAMFVLFFKILCCKGECRAFLGCRTVKDVAKSDQGFLLWNQHNVRNKCVLGYLRDGK